MAYDDRAKALAARMLAPKPKGKGQAITITQPATDGTYDPATDTTSGASPAVQHQGSGIEGEPYSAFSIAQGLVAAGDVRFLLSPLKIDGSDMPTPVADAWTATLGGKLHVIKRVEVTRPAGLGVLFELQLRA